MAGLVFRRLYARTVGARASISPCKALPPFLVAGSRLLPASSHLAARQNATRAIFQMHFPSIRSFSSVETAKSDFFATDLTDNGRALSPCDGANFEGSGDRDVAATGPSLSTLAQTVEHQKNAILLLEAQCSHLRELYESLLVDINALKSEQGKSDKDFPRRTGDDTTSEGVRTSSQSASTALPEWTDFLKHLKSLKFYKEHFGGVQKGANSFEDSSSLKRALSKFSQVYSTIFQSLPQQDLQTLADYGCPSDDQRTVASARRLRNHFQIKEKSVSSPCVMQSSCESAFVKSTNAPPGLSDVMRLIYKTFDVAPPGERRLPDDVKLSIVHLLKHITNLSLEQDANLSGLGFITDTSRHDEEEKPCKETADNTEDRSIQTRRIITEKENSKDALDLGSEDYAEVDGKMKTRKLKKEEGRNALYAVEGSGGDLIGLEKSASLNNHISKPETNTISPVSSELHRMGTDDECGAKLAHECLELEMNALPVQVEQDNSGSLGGDEMQSLDGVEENSNNKEDKKMSNVDEHSKVFDDLVTSEETMKDSGKKNLLASTGGALAATEAQKELAEKKSLSDLVMENASRFRPRPDFEKDYNDDDNDVSQESRIAKGRRYGDEEYGSRRQQWTRSRNDYEQDEWDRGDSNRRSGRDGGIGSRRGRFGESRGSFSDYNGGQGRRGSEDRFSNGGRRERRFENGYAKDDSEKYDSRPQHGFRERERGGRSREYESEERDYSSMRREKGRSRY